MTHTFVADDIRVDSDERGFSLVIDTDEGDKLFVDIQAVVLEFYDRVRSDIGPYAAEAENARSAVSRGVTLDEYVGRTTPDDGPDLDLVRDLRRGK